MTYQGYYNILALEVLHDDKDSTGNKSVCKICVRIAKKTGDTRHVFDLFAFCGVDGFFNTIVTCAYVFCSFHRHIYNSVFGYLGRSIFYYMDFKYGGCILFISDFKY